MASNVEDLDQVLAFLKRSAFHWKRALLVFVIGMLITVPVVLSLPRSYRSETIILYQDTIRSSDITTSQEGGGEASVHRAGARLRELLLSRTSLEPIITKLQLYKYGTDPSPHNMLDSVDEMRKHIIFKARDGDTFSISFEGNTPEEAKEATRLLGDCILQEALSRRSDQAKVLKEFLSAEAERNATDLKTKELEFAKFIAAHPVLSARLQAPPGAAAMSPTRGPVAAAPAGDPILASLEFRAARLERQLAKSPTAAPAAPPPKPAPFRPPPDSAELVAARRDLADKLARFTDKHPDVTAARARVSAAEQADSAIKAEALQAYQAAQASAAAAAQEEAAPKNAADEAALSRDLSNVRAQIAQRQAAIGAAGGAPRAAAAVPETSEASLEHEFHQLQRDANEARERQAQLDAKLFNASITASSVTTERNSQVSVLDPAYLPNRPVSKPRSLMVLFGALISLFLAVAAALVSTKFDDRIYDAVDIEKLDALPILGVIPRALPPKQ
jgi:uncharacterized protein involved in exopolysaccharide biosynthesis